MPKFEQRPSAAKADDGVRSAEHSPVSVGSLKAAPKRGWSVTTRMTVNGRLCSTEHDTRVTLLDLLREQLGLTGTKKGCDHGQCGACTVHVNGEAVLSCLLLAASLEEAKVTTIEGVGTPDRLHPMQQAFIDHDGLQCGYCTPGQIMSAIACAREGKATDASAVRDWMSGNLCRCAAYPQIVRAVLDGARRMRD